ncbi:hypothetical protein [Candidatus Cyanaurora vandensis]|uniref:hypothetical protein n=1 Tax=Candidatus Cyanaurora vandensis TaxID=2714958 RepID=UPI00257943FE|nr:hypothetical protein [Candidatus Cyanaurora vandensis]
MRPIQVLLQTTIPTVTDDWNIARFSLLHQYLASLKNTEGQPLCVVIARDREADSLGNDPVLSTLDQTEFDQVWLFAVDVGDGLSPADLAGLTQFREQGKGILTARDHMDLGCSLCALPDLGAAHFFHSHNPDPDTSRHRIDDPYTTYISWPNYHSGRNGDFQEILPQEPFHPLLVNPERSDGMIHYFPAHPHEGAVGVPTGETQAQVIAQGTSLVTGRKFNLAVAFERHTTKTGQVLGRGVAASTFHHFCDYNWDAKQGAPSFVDEPVGETMQTEPTALQDTHRYMRNLLLWLAGQEHD